MKALRGSVAFVIFYCIFIAVATKTDDVNLCKRQPFRGRCPAVKGKSPTRSQFVLRYYLRDNECVSYPFGHCANDESEPILYRYKEECEKACLHKSYDSGTTAENNLKITDSDKSGSKQIANTFTITTTTTTTTTTTSSTTTTITSKLISQKDATVSTERTTIAARKNSANKLLTECERRRQASVSGLIKSDYIPICTADGSFRPLQCETKRENCFCVDHNGIKIPNSDTNGTKKPDCKRIIKAQKLLMYECLSPMDSGPCNTAITKWYYNNEEQKCIQFEYSGCGGNGNNYPTKAACEKQCRSTNNEPKCKDDLEPLRNDDGQLINCSTNACPDGYLCSVAQLGSACCPTNASSSIASDICQLPKDRGSCDQYELRFYYNNRLGECKYFFYGGCEGNANNFERAEECEQICRQGKVKISATSIVSAPQLITSGPQMRKLSKEFGTKNIKKNYKENKLIELSDDGFSSTSVKNDTNGVTNGTINTDDNSAISDTLKFKKISSSMSMSNDHSTTAKDLSITETVTASTDHNKLHSPQKVGQNIHKKSKQTEAKTTMFSDITDKITYSTTVKPENKIATSGIINDNLVEFISSADESTKKKQKFLKESITSIAQQLSSSEEPIKKSTSATMITGKKLANTRRLSPISVMLSTLPVTSPPHSTTMMRPVTSSAATESMIIPKSSENIKERCFQRFDRGNCNGQFTRWYWDFERRTCQVFTYTGCAGNGNNFRSRDDCFAACHQPPPPTPDVLNVCEHDIHPGDCIGVFHRFAFDATINDCRPFTYTGCGGNGNNFGSSVECRNRCVKQRPTLPTDVCQHPIEVGECSGVFPRFAYDLVANECRPFTYGGCGGNGNNFGSVAECTTKCVRDQSDVSVQCPSVDLSLCVEPCVLFINRRGCHECTCPVAKPKMKNDLVQSATTTSTLSDASFAEANAPAADKQTRKKSKLKSRGGKTSQRSLLAELGEKCSQPMDAGPCENFIERWFFNINTSSCESFQYGGCAGNRNHFFSEHECEIHCARFFNESTSRKGINAYQSTASHEQYDAVTLPQMPNEHDEYEDITDNQQRTAYRSSFNDITSVTNDDSWNRIPEKLLEYEADFEPENRKNIEMNSKRAYSSQPESSAISNDLYLLQHSNNVVMRNENLDHVTSLNFSRNSKVQQQDQQQNQQKRQLWSISSGNKLNTWILDSNVSQQTVAEQKNTHDKQINVSKSEIIPIQKDTKNNGIRFNCAGMNYFEHEKVDLKTTYEKTAQVKETDFSQIQQQNEQSLQVSSEEQILGHDELAFQNGMVKDSNSNSLTSDEFGNQIMDQNPEISSDEQPINSPQTGILEWQTAAGLKNHYNNKDNKRMNTIIDESTERNRNPVLGYHVRIMNRGSVLDLLSSSSPLSVSFSTLLLSSTTPYSTVSSSLSSINDVTDLNTTNEISYSSRIADKHETSNGARGIAHFKHANIEQIKQPSKAEEFPHDSISMQISTHGDPDQKFITSKIENDMSKNNFNTITDSDSISGNAIIDTKSNLSPKRISEEWNVDSDGYRIIDKMGVSNLMTLEFLARTLPSTTVPLAMENKIPSLASMSNTTTPTSISSTTSKNHHSIPFGYTVTPSTINITSTSLSTTADAESIAVDSKVVESFEPSIKSSSSIISQPIPSGKSWLSDGLKSVINSQFLPEQQIYEEVSGKKLLSSPPDSTDAFALAKFSTTINSSNNIPVATTLVYAKGSPAIFPITNHKLPSNGMNTVNSNVEFQKKKVFGAVEKSMRELEENHYFNVDSSIFMNASTFQNKTHTAISRDRTTEIAKNIDEDEIAAMSLSSRNNFDNTQINSMILKRENPFTSKTSTELHDSVAQSDSRPSVPLNNHHRINTVGSNKLHTLMHQQSQQSLLTNFNEIIGQRYTAAHEKHLAQSTSYQTAVKRGEVEADQTTYEEEEEEKAEEIIESETPNRQNISSLQIPSKTISSTTIRADAVATLQQLQPDDDDTCLLPPDAGTCIDYVPRWFHNSQTAKCEQFSYGSCGGNSNNFPDRHSCEAKCSQDDRIKSQLPERCTYQKDEGYGNGYNVKWYFNLRNLRCEQMVYRGQGGNSNQFETAGDCQTFCISLNGKVFEANYATVKEITLTASNDSKNQQQPVVYITGIEKLQKNAQGVVQTAAESQRFRIAANTDSINNEELQQINSKQHFASSSSSLSSPSSSSLPLSSSSSSDPGTSDRSGVETMTLESHLKESSLTDSRDYNNAQVIEKKAFDVKTANKNNSRILGLVNIFEEIKLTPFCPNGHKPLQDADGRPMMCLPGRNQCTRNSLCYFNGVDFFCCPNAEDPYDEHIFGGYGGDEVKRGYKNAKKRPISANEMIVRKLRLKRQLQTFTSGASGIRAATRIDSKLPKYSMARAAFKVNDTIEQTKNICIQNSDVGKCNGAHLRFFYDYRVGICRLFYYSGCGGNENNFATEEECEKQCKNNKAENNVTPPGSCPFGELPLGDNAPVICGKDAGSFECPKGYYCRMGPPNVCCLEKFQPDSEKILVTKKDYKNIRFSPQQSDLLKKDDKVEEENSTLLTLPTNICPDGSDALLDESTQQPLKCGSGYDGESLCPIGYYCSIDSEKNGRLCCQLDMMGAKIPPPPKIPPYFGMRPSNPGEVIPRGSLPNDFASKKLHPVGNYRASETIEEATDFSGNLVPSDIKLQDDVYGRMMLKSNDHTSRAQAHYHALDSASSSPEAEEVQIDIGEIKDPFESLEYDQKPNPDRSICLMKPNEGRTCREDESPPRTNLQYFYSSRDKRCKLYFYRGCGGSQNRFDTKRHCELTCADV